MLDLFDKETGKFLGQISDEEFKFLQDNLEEESENDEDYFFDRDTIDYLKEMGMSPHLEKTLNDSLGTSESTEIIFKKK